MSKVINFPSSKNNREIGWIAERCNSLMDTIILDNSLTESERCAVVLILGDCCSNYLADYMFPDKDYEKYRDEDNE